MVYMTLAEMLEGLRIEARISTNASHGLNLREPHTYLLNRVQSDLYLNYDWPSLKTLEYADISAGQRYVAIPEGLSFESLETIFAPDLTAKYRPMRQGITNVEINMRDPDNVSDREFPPVAWANYIDATAESNHNMIELWPVTDRATRLLFKGRRVPATLVDDDDRSTLDAYAIIMHAAAEILAGQKAEDAALKLDKAKERVRMLRIRQSDGNNKPTLLSGRPGYENFPRAARRGLDYME
jgi:hypothetical protein